MRATCNLQKLYQHKCHGRLQLIAETSIASDIIYTNCSFLVVWSR